MAYLLARLGREAPTKITVAIKTTVLVPHRIEGVEWPRLYVSSAVLAPSSPAIDAPVCRRSCKPRSSLPACRRASRQPKPALSTFPSLPRIAARPFRVAAERCVDGSRSDEKIRPSFPGEACLRRCSRTVGNRRLPQNHRNRQGRTIRSVLSRNRTQRLSRGHPGTGVEEV